MFTVRPVWPVHTAPEERGTNLLEPWAGGGPKTIRSSRSSLKREMGLGSGGDKGHKLALFFFGKCCPAHHVSPTGHRESPICLNQVLEGGDTTVRKIQSGAPWSTVARSGARQWSQDDKNVLNMDCNKCCESLKLSVDLCWLWQAE